MDKTAREGYSYILVTLFLSSLVLVAVSVFMIQTFAIEYGVGAGAYIQGGGNVSKVVAILQQTVIRQSTAYHSMLDSYIAFVISLILFWAAMMLLSHRHGRYEGANRRYSLSHSILSVVYALLVYVTIGTSGIVSGIIGIYLDLAYLAAALCFGIDIYIEYTARRHVTGQPSRRINIRMDPESPYANIVSLKEQLFAAMHGGVKVVDKHFNSKAMENLYRLLDGNFSNLSSIKVITSKEMLDSDFGGNYYDMQKELKNNGVDFEVKVMTDLDAEAQHERFIFDDSKAVKIPPLNIINRKSEHITSTGLLESRRRFDELYQRASKYENYVSGKKQS